MPRIRFTQDLHLRHLGPLPILIPFLERIGLRQIVDSHVEARRRARLTPGQILSALVLNRLLSPRALYTIEEWSRHAAIPEALGIRPDDLNDDCLLRTLDALFPQLERIQGSLTWHVLEHFDVDVSFIHWDVTSFFFEDEFAEEKQDPHAPLVRYGKPKDRDAGKLRKQMQIGVATAEDGGIPFWYRPFSGNAAEIAQVGDVMETLKEVVRRSSFTLVGDTKLVSETNILRALRCGLFFLAPEPRSNERKDQYLKLRREGRRLRRLAYGRDRKPHPHIYMGFEDSATLKDGETGTEHRLRRLFIVSSEERRAARRNRRRKLARLEQEIDKIRRNLGRYPYKTAEVVRSRVASLLKAAKLEEAFRWDVQETDAGIVFTFEKDRDAFRRMRQLDGVYTLITNLGAEYTIDELLERYKRQYLSERRFGDIKGPLHLRPLFLKKNARIVALTFVVYVALLVYCLIERSVRQHLARTGTTLPDPYTRRPLKQPTTRRLMAAFEFYAVQVQPHGADWEYLAPEFTPIQQQILMALGIDKPLGFLADATPGIPRKRRRNEN